MFYKFTTTATNNIFGQKVTDIVTDYIAAYSYGQAKRHIVKRLESAGWTVETIQGVGIAIEDIRDSIDHMTD